jgi:2'-5' RNA ligase
MISDTQSHSEPLNLAHIHRRHTMSTQPNHTNHLPDLYRSHPSRPLPYKPSTGARQGVIVVFPTPLTPSDDRRIQELQGLRKEWDQAWERWLPHVTLVPPFSIPTSRTADGKERGEEMNDPMMSEHRDSRYLEADDPPAEGCTETERGIYEHLHHACATFKSRTITLSRINTFSLRSYTNVHLRPAEGDGYRELVSLQGACERAVESCLVEVEKPTNRAERRRQQHPTTASQGASTASTVNSDQMHNSSPSATESSARTYTRPMYREAEDEARCITLPTTEITIDPIPNDGLNHAPLESATISQSTATPSTTQPRPLSDAIPDQATNHPARKSRAKGNYRAFTPHLSIGQARTPSSRDHLVSLVQHIIDEDRVKQEPTGINCRIDRVWFLSKPVGASGTYEVVSSIPLASKDVGQ